MLTGAGALALIGSSITAGAAWQSTASATVRHTGPTGHVLLVGTFKGHKGQYTSIQAAVNAAKPGDWILVAPGDYHETSDLTSPPSSYSDSADGAVMITTSGLHLRGMSRSGVVVDGTKPGSPQCSSSAANQQFGHVQSGQAVGRNGITVYKANNVSIDNLTVCNFLSGSKGGGNGIWWNGGAGGTTTQLAGYEGSYLTATSSFFNGEATAATYGIFASHAAGPGSWNQLYANNQNDSGMYVGACLQVCNVTIQNAWMENNALGYSGTNSGGAIVITHSLFDNNYDGLDTNTAITGDPPAPQNGACPNNGISKITHTHSCWVVEYSKFVNNNNNFAPGSGSAQLGPIGTGMTLSAGHNDTVMHNTFSGNGAWGLFVLPYADSGGGSDGATCANTGGHVLGGLGCILDPNGDAILSNTFVHNGWFKNPTNSDIAELTYGTHVANCFSKNVVPDGTYAPNLQKAEATCTGKNVLGNVALVTNLFNQVVCDAGLGTCPAGSHYPGRGTVKLSAVPTKKLPTMPNPCAGVPSNAWCVGGKPI